MGYAGAFLGCDTVPAVLDQPVTSSATPPPPFTPTQTLGPQLTVSHVMVTPNNKINFIDTS